jgi:hypothetical protein
MRDVNTVRKAAHSVDFDQLEQDRMQKRRAAYLEARTPKKREKKSGVGVLVQEMRPNTAELSPAEMEKAQMVRASKTAHDKGFTAAQAEIDSGALKGWRIDTSLSTKESLVLVDGVNGDVKIAYRGTRWSNPQDLVTDATTLMGKEHLAPQIKASRAQLEEVRLKYDRLPSELIGYSKGSAHALMLGDEFRIPSTNFNPLLGPKQLFSSSETPHTIIRTTEDPVSIGLVFAKAKKNYTTKSILPIYGLDDPKTVHDLKHFTRAGNRQPGGMHRLMADVVKKGQQMAHLETFDAMKTGVERGQTFTEALDVFNATAGSLQRVDVLPDGSLGSRIHSGSGTVQYWKDAGGRFTEAEQAHLDSHPPPATRELSPVAQEMGLRESLTVAQKAHLNSLAPEERASFMQERRAELKTHMEALDAAVKPHESMIKAVMPKTATIASGVVSGLAAHAVMEGIDPQHKMNAVASEATEGALAGGIGVGTMAAMGGSAALAPEVLAASAAYVAGGESQKAITKALIKGGTSKRTAEAVGSVSGGAIGGTTAAAVGMGATVGGAALAGVETGELLGTIGGPVGMAVGAAVGAGLGAVVGGIGWLFGHH